MKVSVIITNHNGLPLLPRAIRSALHQDGIGKGDYEVIVVDDASTDNSRIAIDAFTENIGGKNVLTPIYLKKNEGLASAINKGIINSGGMFVARLDHSDVYRSLYLAIMSEYLEHNKDVDWVMCDHYIINDMEQIVGRSDKQLACCIVFRRHALESIGLYDERFRTGETADILTRLMQDNRYKDRGAHIPIPLYKWYREDNSLTQGGAKGGT